MTEADKWLEAYHNPANAAVTEEHRALIEFKTNQEIRKRITDALDQAGRSAMGLPGHVDTFIPWLVGHGIKLVLR